MCGPCLPGARLLLKHTWTDQTGFFLHRCLSVFGCMSPPSARLVHMFLCLTFASPPSPFPCPISTFACSSQVLLSFSLSLKCSLLFLNQLFVCSLSPLSPSSKSSPLVFASDVTWPLFSEESGSWVTGQKVLWASLWISLPVSFQAQGHWGSLGVGGVRAQSRSHGFWQLYCG